MSSTGLEKISATLRYVLLMTSLYFVLLYVILAILRLPYPFELEWMEGGSLQHVDRILSGQKLYVKPSLEFIPFIYTPAYFYLSALFTKIMGIGFSPLRLVSFLSSLGCFIIVFLFVYHETRRRLPAVTALCLFAATFKASGGFTDLARVDSLFLFLLMAGLYLVRLRTSTKSLIFAGILISLSFLTKQLALLMALPVIVYRIVTLRRQGIILAATIAAIVALSTVILDHLHNGWYTYYVFELPREHTLTGRMLVPFWTKDLVLRLPVALGIALFGLLGGRTAFGRTARGFYLSLAIGMVGMTWISRMHPGAYLNVLLPGYASIAVLFGLGIHRVLAGSRDRVRRPGVKAVVYVFCIFQFAYLVYDPTPLIATGRDSDAGRKLVNSIAQIQGDVFIPCHGYLASMAGKRSYCHRMAYEDLLRGGRPEHKAELLQQFTTAVTRQRFGAIILDGRRSTGIVPRYYREAGPTFDSRDVFWPVTGKIMRPEIIYVPRE